MTTETKNDTDTDIDWAAVKITPRLSGLPMSVWITENQGYPHDVRVKVGRLHGGRGSWSDAVPVGVRPQPHEIIPGSLPAADLALAVRWIALNHDTIIAFWDGVIEFDQVPARLHRLP